MFVIFCLTVFILSLLLTGSYAGFDENQLTCRQDGKARVINYLKSEFGYRTVVMIGDGSTDLAAKPPAVSWLNLPS